MSDFELTNRLLQFCIPVQVIQL